MRHLALSLSIASLLAFAPGANTASGQEATKDTATVYFTRHISPKGLKAVYQAMHWTPTDKVAVKVSTGEPPSSNYLRPELIEEVVKAVKGTIVECNTAYGGPRSRTDSHREVAKKHGFTRIADVDIQDADGSTTLKVTDGEVLKQNYVGSHFGNYGSYLVISHFKGHQMAGFGGAIKNISIGIASAKGKAWIHSGGTSERNPWGGRQEAFLKAMAEAGKSVSDAMGQGKRMAYINVMNRLSIDCDCDGHPAEPDIHDIGVLASTDPVALDQACMDLIDKAEGNESFVKRVANRDGMLTVRHADKLGLGTRVYKLVLIDE
ncbi:MAG: DUF362 domain-containing protein [Mediterranea sp.]|jgi:uncharacterized Fe-S center protein|nr:DUF362 domain-containing protein [Mediterranea sp.]